MATCSLSLDWLSLVAGSNPIAGTHKASQSGECCQWPVAITMQLQILILQNLVETNRDAFLAFHLDEG